MEIAPQAKNFTTQRSKTIGKIVGILTKKYIIMENSPPLVSLLLKTRGGGGISIQFPLIGSKIFAERVGQDHIGLSCQEVIH